jgi:hypothetical protein
MPVVNPEYYLNQADVNSIYTEPHLLINVGKRSTYNPASQTRLQSKISRVRNDPIIITSQPGQPGIIDASKFDRIYVNSDIHSDYRNFINYLKNLNLINIPSGLSIYEDKTNPSSRNDIYNPAFITDTTWKARNTLYIIVGDLVDGRRGIAEVDDPRGSFDLLLHMFIYNLRLRALEMNSDILFTIGNHDFITAIKHTMIKNDRSPWDIGLVDYQPGGPLRGNRINTSGWSWYQGEMADYTKIFFSGNDNISVDKYYWNNIVGMNNRYNALTMFYSLSPYLFIEIINSDNKRIIFIHSSIAQSGMAGVTDYLVDLRNYQRHIEISALRNSFILDELPHEVLPPNIDHTEANSLFYRILINLTKRDILKNICAIYGYRYPNTTLIVGHCPTLMTEFDNEKQGKTGSLQEYDTCHLNDNFGCIITKCFDSNFKLIAVDTGFSRAFRSKEQIQIFLTANPGLTIAEKRKAAAVLGPSGKERVSEILKIKKSNNLPNFDSFYRVRWNPYTQLKITNESVAPYYTLGIIGPDQGKRPWTRIDNDCLNYVTHELTANERNNKQISSERVNELVIPGTFDIEDVKSCLNNIGINIFDCLKYVTLELTGDERINKKITPERVNELVIPGIINIDSVKSCLHNIGVNISPIQLGSANTLEQKYLKYKKKYLKLKKYMRQI